MGFWDWSSALSRYNGPVSYFLMASTFFVPRLCYWWTLKPVSSVTDILDSYLPLFSWWSVVFPILISLQLLLVATFMPLFRVCVLPSQPRNESEYRGHSGLENKANLGETYFGHLLPVWSREAYFSLLQVSCQMRRTCLKVPVSEYLK